MRGGRLHFFGFLRKLTSLIPGVSLAFFDEYFLGSKPIDVAQISIAFVGVDPPKQR